MTHNPHLRRLLHEDGQISEPLQNSRPTANTATGTPERKQAPPAAEPDVEPEDQSAQAQAQSGTPVAASVQQLAQLWKSGEHMGVAAKLMFTDASYKDLVDLAFIIGQEQGRELGALLDELADTEGIKPPAAPPEYSDEVRAVVGGKDEESVI